jgi:hypothetical protein
VTDSSVEHIFPYVVDEYVKYRLMSSHSPDAAVSFSALERRLGSISV